MITPLVMLALMSMPYLVALLLRAGRRSGPEPETAAAFGLCLLFAFTGLGHFTRTAPMAEMLPPFVPGRLPLVYATGLLEWAIALGFFVPRFRLAAGLAAAVVLVAFFPTNIYAAFARVPMGGHEWGPVYLLIRAPLQAAILLWVYHFTIRPALKRKTLRQLLETAFRPPPPRRADQGPARSERPRVTPDQEKRSCAAVVLLAGLALAVAAQPLFSQGREEAAPSTVEPPTVTLAQASGAEVFATVPVAGTILPRNEVLVTPQLGGYQIRQVLVDIGDRVEAGDLLVRLRKEMLLAQQSEAVAEFARAEAAVRQAQSQIESAQAALDQAEAELARNQSLQDSATISQAVLDVSLAKAESARAALASARDGRVIAEAQLEQAEVQVEIAELNLSWTEITAPVDGVVSGKSAQVGALTSLGGAPLLTIIEHGTLEFEAEVIETALATIEPGDPADLDVAGIGPITGIVRMVPPSVDAVTRLGRVRVTPEVHAALRAGLFASGEIITERREGVTVPVAAVLTDANGAFVQVVEDGVVARRPVIPGLVWKDRREIVEGLAHGEFVIARAGAFFHDSDRVRAQSEEEARLP